MREFSLLIIKILTYQPNGEQMIIEWLLTIGLLIFLMVALYKIFKVVKTAFQNSLRGGDDDCIDLDESELEDFHEF